jgi:hypothetical protein
MFKFHFRPISHSWVALNPKAKGTIQFIGGAFFGTFAPTLFYRHLLHFFYNQGYTIIVFPFAFSFNHYKESFFLLREQYLLIPELISLAKSQGADPSVYLYAKNYIWLGHSIGCKYIALLEAADRLPQNIDELSVFLEKLFKAKPSDSFSLKQINDITIQIHSFMEGLRAESNSSRSKVQDIMLNEQQLVQPNAINNESIYKNLFIKDQSSILLAPVNSNTSDAIKPDALARWVDSLGWGVQPSPGLTQKLILQSQLFNLLVLAKFTADKIAPNTVNWFYECLNKPPAKMREPYDGGHLRPLGLVIGSYVVNPILDYPPIQSLETRNKALEYRLIKMLSLLEKQKET